MAALSRSERDQLRERVRELVHADPARSSRSIAKVLGCSTPTVIRYRNTITTDPPADGDQALEHGAQRAPACRCDRALPTEGGRCLRCGRTVDREVAHG
jgi:hypothetical protein